MSSEAARPLLYTMAEAADMLRMCERTLREHVKRGEIRYVLTGGGSKKPRRSFTRQDLEDFIARQGRWDCPSTNTEEAGSTTTTSDSSVIDIMDRLVSAASARPKKSNSRNERKRG